MYLTKKAKNPDSKGKKHSLKNKKKEKEREREINLLTLVRKLLIVIRIINKKNCNSQIHLLNMRSLNSIFSYRVKMKRKLDNYPPDLITVEYGLFSPKNHFQQQWFLTKLSKKLLQLFNNYSCL